VNPSSKDDPVQQIIRYVNNIRKGKYKTPKGRQIRVSENTPFYGYIMCEVSEKVKEWLQFEKDFTPMPDGMGWFRLFGNNSLYMEVLSWEKVLRDAEMRNSEPLRVCRRPFGSSYAATGFSSSMAQNCYRSVGL